MKNDFTKNDLMLAEDLVNDPLTFQAIMGFLKRAKLDSPELRAEEYKIIGKGIALKLILQWKRRN